MPGLGEARKFISPEDLEALTKASDAIKEAGSDEGKRQEMIEARKRVKEQISVNMEREIYRRAEEFGAVLLDFARQEGSDFWENLKDTCLSDKCYGYYQLKKDPRYEPIIRLLNGLSDEQRLIFSRIADNIESRTKTVAYLKSRFREIALSEKYGRDIRVEEPEYVSKISDEEYGELLFRSCNTRSNPKYSKPVGKIKFVGNDRVCIRLEIEDQADVQTLHAIGDVIKDKKGADSKAKEFGGFMSPERSFYDPRSGYLINPNVTLIVLYCPNEPQLYTEDRLIENTAHEKEGHLVNRIVRSALTNDAYNRYQITPREHVLDYRDHDDTTKDILRIEAEYNTNPDKESLLLAYRENLVRLRRYFLEMARDELVADFQARYNFSHVTSLVQVENRTTKNVLYDYYEKEFVNRRADMPPVLFAEIKREQALYRETIKQQAIAAEKVLISLRKPVTARREGAFYALLQDTPLSQWQERLDKLFKDEITDLDTKVKNNEMVSIENAYEDRNDKSVAINEYRECLIQMRQWALEMAKDELLARHRRGHGFGSSADQLTRFKLQEPYFYNYFYYFLGNRISQIPAPLVKEVEASVRDYKRIVVRQSVTADHAEVMLKEAGDEEKINNGEFIAVLTDTPMPQWYESLKTRYHDQIAKTESTANRSRSKVLANKIQNKVFFSK